MSVQAWVESCNAAASSRIQSNELLESDYGAAKAFLIGARVVQGRYLASGHEQVQSIVFCWWCRDLFLIRFFKIPQTVCTFLIGVSRIVCTQVFF